MMHLPALIMSGQIEKVIRAVSQLGIAVRGLFGEGSDSSGSIFQISNQQTLGESEWEIIKRLTNVLNSIIEQEKNARQKLLEAQPERILDKVCRAYGILMNVHILSSGEAMKLLSLLRLAVDLGMLEEFYRRKIDRLFIEVQPGHVQFTAQKEVSVVERDVLRARFIREQLKNLPLLNFDKLGNIT
jgi:protein arginine kinase